MDAGDILVVIGSIVGTISAAVAAIVGAVKLKWDIAERRRQSPVKPELVLPRTQQGTENAPVAERQSRAMKLALVSAAGLLLVAVALVALGRNVQPPSGIVNRFDDDAQGWAAILDAEMEHVQTGGNPGGYLRARDLQTQEVPWYWEAPEQYLGDKLDVVGKMLMFDLRQSTTSNQYQAASDIWLIGQNRLELLYNLPRGPGMNWTSYSVPLDGGVGWQTVDKGHSRPTTREDMRAVLGNMIHLRIRGEYAGGPDEGGLDNVTFGR